MKSTYIKTVLSYLIATVIGLGAVSHVSAAGEKLFYRGELDGSKAQAPNGAIVNEDYKKFLVDGVFGSTQMFEVRDGVHTITGYSLSNYTFIEGETGLIAFDTGSNIGMGREALKMISKVTDKPIVAIIYSHHHYTGGASAYAEAAGSEQVVVYGHPDIDKNLGVSSGLFGPMQNRRAGIQLGLYLPPTGPDAALAPAEPHFDDPALNAHGHLPVSRPVNDGEELIIDGLKAVFYYAVSDTPDSLIVHFPDLDLVLHNTAVTPMLFSQYTLRGDYYRDPVDMIQSIDTLRQLDAKYVVGAHGYPLTDREQARDVATAHRDAYSFVYNQSVRGINKGMNPEQLVQTVRLPKHLRDHPWLYPAYVDNEYNVRGQYRGILGWYAEDTADLHPPTTLELGSVMVEGFGGSAQIISSAE